MIGAIFRAVYDYNQLYYKHYRAATEWGQSEVWERKCRTRSARLGIQDLSRSVISDCSTALILDLRADRIQGSRIQEVQMS